MLCRLLPNRDDKTQDDVPGVTTPTLALQISYQLILAVSVVLGIRTLLTHDKVRFEPYTTTIKPYETTLQT